MSEFAHRRSESGTFGLFVLGAVFGAAVAYLAAKQTSGRSLNIDAWLKDHGIDGHHLLDRVKKLLHVRKNGYGFVGGNGHQAADKH